MGLILVLAVAAGCGGARKQIRKGDAWLEDGRLSAAERAYRAALDKRPGDPRALVGLARALLASGEPEAALVPAQAALADEQRGAAAVLAQALVAVGRGAEAGPVIDAAVEASPDDTALLALQAESRLARRDLFGARALAAGPLAMADDPRERSLAAWVLSRTGRHDAAVALAVSAAADALNDLQVQAEAGAVFRAAGDAERARGAVRTGAGVRVPPYAREAARLDAGGDREGALRRMAWARALDPGEGRHAAALGTLYLGVGEWTRAAAELEAALDLPPYRIEAQPGGVRVARPDDLPLEQQRAGIAELQRAAAAAWQAALDGAGGGADDWVRVAELWASAGDDPAAIRAGMRALDEDGGHRSALLSVARAFSRVGELDRAIGYARLAWSRNQGDRDVALALGALYEQRDEPDAAADLYADALRSNPGDARLQEAANRVAGYTP